MENIPSTSNHESLKGIFSKFGVVEYVSLPKFKSTGDIKGFAFVEFAEVESARRACGRSSVNGNENGVGDTNGDGCGKDNGVVDDALPEVQTPAVLPRMNRAMAALAKEKTIEPKREEDDADEDKYDEGEGSKSRAHPSEGAESASSSPTKRRRTLSEGQEESDTLGEKRGAKRSRRPGRSRSISLNEGDETEGKLKVIDEKEKGERAKEEAEGRVGGTVATTPDSDGTAKSKKLKRKQSAVEGDDAPKKKKKMEKQISSATTATTTTTTPTTVATSSATDAGKKKDKKKKKREKEEATVGVESGQKTEKSGTKKEIGEEETEKAKMKKKKKKDKNKADKVDACLIESVEPVEPILAEEAKEEADEKVEKMKTKPKNRRKKQDNKNKKNKKGALKTTPSIPKMSVMPKVEWLTLRSEYLALQRQRMSALKQNLTNARIEEEQEEAAAKEHGRKKPTINERASIISSFHDGQKMEVDSASSLSVSPKKTEMRNYEKVPGLIVKVSAKEEDHGLPPRSLIKTGFEKEFVSPSDESKGTVSIAYMDTEEGQLIG